MRLSVAKLKMKREDEKVLVVVSALIFRSHAALFVFTDDALKPDMLHSDFYSYLLFLLRR